MAEIAQSIKLKIFSKVDEFVDFLFKKSYNIM